MPVAVITRLASTPAPMPFIPATRPVVMIPARPPVVLTPARNVQIATPGFGPTGPTATGLVQAPSAVKPSTVASSDQPSASPSASPSMADPTKLFPQSSNGPAPYSGSTGSTPTGAPAVANMDTATAGMIIMLLVFAFLAFVGWKALKGK
jgi:hypothetical protein